MELSKRALGFLSRQYRIILSQNRLANALGSCALSALMCAAVGAMGGVTAGFMAPESAVAGPIGVTISPDTESWISTGDISASATASGVDTIGIEAKPNGSISMTLEAGNTLTVTSDVTGGDVYAYGIETMAMNNDGYITITTNGIMTVTALGRFTSANGITALNGKDSDITNTGTIKVTASGTGTIVDAGGITAQATNNTIANDGTITTIATATASGATSMAMGIAAQTTNGDNVILNNGTINANATRNIAKAYGIMAEAANNDNYITNVGTIDLTATGNNATAHGIATDITKNSSNSTIINDGTIITTATGGAAKAFGVGTDLTDENIKSNNNTITNNGTIKASATATGTGSPDAIAAGIIAIASNNNTIANIGTLDIIATGVDASAVGVAAMAGNNNDIDNSGIINATGTGDCATVNGIQVEATNNNTIANDSIIKVSATAQSTSTPTTAYGVEAKATNNNTIANSGTIGVITTAESNATAIGISAEGGSSNVINDGTINSQSIGSNSYAYGIVTTAIKAGDATNNGTLNIAAKGDGADVKAFGIVAAVANTSNVTNNSMMNISATAVNGDATALGMVATGTNAIFNNFGIIDVSATGKNTNACQAYVEAGTANIGTWAMKLGENYGPSSSTGTGVGYYVFGVESGATLNFGATAGQGANFIISGLGDDFELGQEYKISDMVYRDGMVTGYIASATSAFDFLPVELIGSGSYKNQSIKATLDLTKDTSPAHAGATQLLANLKGHVNGLSKVLSNHRGNSGGAGADMRAQSDTSTMYADASKTFTDAGGSYISPESPVWKAFLMPFYSTTSAHNGSYDTDMAGLVVGASRNVNDDFVFGFHVSLSKANSDGTYTDSDALSYALGVNGVYNFDESLYLRGQLTGLYAENEFDMVSSTGAFAYKANADMDSYGMYAELAAGYDITLAPQHMLTPELGLSYIYVHMEGFDSAFGNAAFSMDSEDYNALYADASLRWTGAFDLGTSEKGSSLGMLKPTVKAGVRQALTDPETSSTMNVFGTSATTHADANETSFTCEAGLQWEMDEVTLSAIYTGEFGNVDNSHMGMFKVEWGF